jgi:DNA-binding beta-propeller fold protein YncE
MILDLAAFEDDAHSDVLFDGVLGYLPALRGAGRDAGVPNHASMGPGDLLVHPDGRRLFVSNFNANSISLYDLALGAYGQLVAETELVGENPYAMAFSPDERFLVFGNYLGEVSDEVSSSTLGVMDVDPDSPTYLEVVTWIANR